MNNKKVYLDTCILSGLVNQDIEKSELDSLDKLTEIDRIIFVTSSKTLQEFEDITEESKRKSFKILYKIITKIYAPPPVMQYSGLFGDTPWGVPFGDGPGEMIQAPFDILKRFFKHDDAIHIFNAYHSGCDYFLTLDKGILKKYKQNRDELSKHLKPIELIDPNMLVTITSQIEW